MQELRSQIPDYAKDIRLNLDSVLSEAGAPGLTTKQIAAVAYASAIASRYLPLAKALEIQAKSVLGEEEITATRSAAAIMAMNNVYYRFAHLVSEPGYLQMPARLRMNAMANPAMAKVDFELCSLAVSAINGCGMCMDSHEKVLRKHEIDALAIQSAVRIAAVVHAAAVTLEQSA
jgi:lipoyl-dependent peroxiredoxin subunit D